MLIQAHSAKQTTSGERLPQFVIAPVRPGNFSNASNLGSLSDYSRKIVDELVVFAEFVIIALVVRMSLPEKVRDWWPLPFAAYVGGYYLGQYAGEKSAEFLRAKVDELADQFRGMDYQLPL